LARNLLSMPRRVGSAAPPRGETRARGAAGKGGDYPRYGVPNTPGDVTPGTFGADRGSEAGPAAA